MLKRGNVVAAVVVTLAAGLLAPADAETVKEQTPVQVRLLKNLKSGHDRKGEQIPFELVKDVTGANGAVILPKGTPVIGTVIRSNGRGMFGKPGKLEFTIDAIKVSDQVRVPLRSTATSVRGRNNTAAAVTTAVLLAPIAVFVKGREVTVKANTEYSVFVDQTTEIPAPGAAIAAAPAKMDPNRLSLIRFKNGTTLTGTIVDLKNCVYTVATDLGQMLIEEAKIESISEKK
jgi:hypothetical protein